MNYRELRDAVLEYLAKVRDEHGPDKWTALGDLSEATAEPDPEVARICWDLVDELLVIRGGHSPHYKVTRVGYNEITSKSSPAAQPSSRVTIVGPVSNSSIAAGDGHAEITNVTNINFLERLAEEIENHPDIPEENKRTWLAGLKEMSRHPMVLEISKTLFSLFKG